MRLINLTPHSVTIINDEGEVLIEIESCGVVARVKKHREPMIKVFCNLAIIPVNETWLGAVEYLPPPENNVFYIVSRVVYEAANHRHDLLIVDEIVRDEHNHVIGCRALARLR